METFCLGYTHSKCDTCQHEKNWQALNQMPDELRLSMQAGMTRINSDKCRLTEMGEYKPAGCHGANCGTTDGMNHSPECVVEAAACQGWLNTPDAVEALLKVMVDRFLGWRLPHDFGPDAGVSFSPSVMSDSPYWPTGTNLLHAGQALEMFKYCLPAELIAPEASHCSDERPCVPCFTDRGPCEEKPAARALTGADFEAFAAAAVDRIEATIIVEGETPEQFRERIAGRVADMGKLTFEMEDTAHQCCGKCEKPADETIQQLDAAMLQHYEAAISDLDQILQAADEVIIALVQAAGGSVTINVDDSAKVIGHQIVSEVSEDRQSFTFRAVPVPAPAVQ